ncbi:hypothetical protein LDV96_004646 [Vibrio parahaemolyticus]|nr:hypothetical protein [Vibrio parahaemolyticus]
MLNTNDAFGRRIARDIPNMPTWMVRAFYLIEKLASVRWWVTLVLTLPCNLMLLGEIYRGAMGLLSTKLIDSPIWVYVLPLGGVVVFYWIGLVSLNFFVMSRYYELRKSWK